MLFKNFHRIQEINGKAKKKRKLSNLSFLLSPLLWHPPLPPASLPPSPSFAAPPPPLPFLGSQKVLLGGKSPKMSFLK